MRALGVDFGFRRIGIAIGESAPCVTSPRPLIAATGTLKRDAEAIARMADIEKAELIVVGVPENPSGDERMSRVCAALADELRALGLRVECVDESHTTREAESAMHSAGLKASRRRRARDAEAARLILERYFHDHSPP